MQNSMNSLLIDKNMNKEGMPELKLRLHVWQRRWEWCDDDDHRAKNMLLKWCWRWWGESRNGQTSAAGKQRNESQFDYWITWVLCLLRLPSGFNFTFSAIYTVISVFSIGIVSPRLLPPRRLILYLYDFYQLNIFFHFTPISCNSETLSIILSIHGSSAGHLMLHSLCCCNVCRCGWCGGGLVCICSCHCSWSYGIWM